MKDNASYIILEAELQKYIIKLLYQKNELSLNEYEKLIKKMEQKKEKAKKNMEHHPEKYIIPINVDIKI